MLTNPPVRLTHWLSLTLLATYTFSTGLAHAAPDKAEQSPYRLNQTSMDMAQNDALNISAAAYQLAKIDVLDQSYRVTPKPLQRQISIPEVYSTEPSERVSFKVKEKVSSPLLDEQPFSEEITQAAQAASLDPSLVHAVIFVESHYRHSAISAKGAVGLMQVLPDTAARYGLRDALHSPKGNIKAGTLYLRDLMLMFDNRLDLVLAAYNAGEGAVKKYAKQIPPYPETRHYVKAVMAKYAINIGANQWQASRYSENNMQSPDSISIKKTDKSYLEGTSLVISKELFMLRH